MPATLEIVCENGDCELDTVQHHCTDEMPDDITVADFQCPYGAQSDSLREVDR